LGDLVAVTRLDCRIIDLGSSADVFDEFARSQDLPCQTELVLYDRPWQDGARRVVGSVEVPSIESRKVLDGPENLVSPNCKIALR
jgi:hypothetical protein